METAYWGHAISIDLFHWKLFPLAINRGFAQVGALAGSSVVLNNGSMQIMFTDSDQFQQQNMTVTSDGINFAQPWTVINPTLPNLDPHNFRNPYMWFDQQAQTYFVVIGGSVNSKGVVLLYKKNVDNYQFISTLYTDVTVTTIDMPNFIQI